jgi:disulfide bond formation protein DsbB
MLLRQTKTYTYAAWAVAIVAMLGSLYFSEILHWTPCVLCWYQRICMYPLVALIAVGIIKKDRNLPYYVLPLSLIGGAIALFHSLIQVGVIPEAAAPCSEGISCAVRYGNYFGFITIPLLSFIAFTLISLAMWQVIRLNKRTSPAITNATSR